MASTDSVKVLIVGDSGNCLKWCHTCIYYLHPSFSMTNNSLKVKLLFKEYSLKSEINVIKHP